MTAAGGQGGTTRLEVVEWVREELSLSDRDTIDVTEQPGTDPRCSDVVTQVAIASPGEEPYAFHIERPLEEVTRMDVVATIAFGGGH